jgi:hypothetical protein
MLVGIGGIVGCGNDSAGVPSLSTDPFLTAQLNIHSATMSTVAPYDTLQLTVTPYTALGHVITDSIVTTYTAHDSTITVTASGLVTAKFTTSNPSWVVATVQDLSRNVTHVDTTYVIVTDQVPSSPLSTFTIQRAPGDSTRLGVYDSGAQAYLDTLRVQATAADGTDLSSVALVRFLSSDSTIARVDPVYGVIQGIEPGRATIRATTTYYGVTKTDSVVMTIGVPVSATVYVQTVPSPTVAGQYVRAFTPVSITIGVGGTIAFAAGFIPNPPYLKWDVVFDDPTAADSTTVPFYSLFGNGRGNIGPIPPLNLNSTDFNPDCLPNFYWCYAQSRSFHTAGIYHYHSALYGSQGTIIVKGP